MVNLWWAQIHQTLRQRTPLPQKKRDLILCQDPGGSAASELLTPLPMCQASACPDPTWSHQLKTFHHSCFSTLIYPSSKSRNQMLWMTKFTCGKMKLACLSAGWGGWESVGGTRGREQWVSQSHGWPWENSAVDLVPTYAGSKDYCHRFSSLSSVAAPCHWTRFLCVTLSPVCC